MARKWKYSLTVIVAVALITTAFFFGRNSASTNGGSASAATSLAPKTSTPTSVFYLDIGASESLGFQPTGIKGHNGARTNTGYANDLIHREALAGVTLTLDQVGCPGDTPSPFSTRPKKTRATNHPKPNSPRPSRT